MGVEEYKKQIIILVQNSSNIELLELAYRFIKKLMG